MERYGTTRQVRHGAVRPGKARKGGAGVALSSEVMRGQARQVRQGQDWRRAVVQGR